MVSRCCFEIIGDCGGGTRLDGHILSYLLTHRACVLSILEGLVLERECELLGFGVGEAAHDHHGVGEDDAVHGEAGLLDWVLVHLVLVLRSRRTAWYVTVLLLN